MSHNESAINRGLRVLGKLKGLSVYDVINIERISINTWSDEEKIKNIHTKKRYRRTQQMRRSVFFSNSNACKNSVPGFSKR